MFCKYCNQKIAGQQKFCTNCGKPFLIDENDKTNNTKQTESIFTKSPPPLHKNTWGVGKIISILIVLFVIATGIYGSLDDDSITKNNDALSSFDSGDSQTAITQLQQSKQDAVTSKNKINTLKNLAYVYSSEGQNEQALETFKEALALTKINSFDYYLIAGEIASLEYKPNSAIISYNKAYELKPAEYQINNALALFYLDIDDVAPQYVDYSKALSYAKKAYEYDTDKSEVTKQNLAIAHYFNENYDQAISLFSTTDLIQHPYIAFWLGLSYASKDDSLNAKIYLQKAKNAGVEMPQEIYDYLNSN